MNIRMGERKEKFEFAEIDTENRRVKIYTSANGDMIVLYFSELEEIYLQYENYRESRKGIEI
jgi:hypothetical protein